MSELKPCPMCGNTTTAGTEKFIFWLQTECTFECYECGFTLTSRTTKKETRTWNSIPRKKGVTDNER